MLELFHVGLTVKDLQRSLSFYRDVAGMAVGEIFDGRSPEFDTLTNNPGAHPSRGSSQSGIFHASAPRV